ncbi:hypothetical protein A6A08_00440 [Nocardiopsis sp. TSRI0078]|uniref:hypothetical protein n=1 Tax=unclassified Nocardiopsis TaxID=2649073 RepID=UPI00093BDBC1|nr:hypothetical protein [Nocardiopsis sp. TSRI0078]OKI23311.1 hypothetical protein A6A08_00440 [Nocardiopsis sp. TSRI0078]
MPPGAPPTAQQAYQAPPAGPPAGAREEPVFPAEAMGATQHINAVPPDAAGATQHINAVPAAPGRGDDRPLFRDEVPGDAGVDTAQFDVQSMNDYDDYDGYDDYGHDGGGTDPRARRRLVLMIGGFALLLVVAGGGAFLLASGGGSGEGANAATVANEADDPGALDPESLFPETMDIEGQGTFTRVAVEDTEDCAAGTHGGYGQVLTENECRQMVRASYLSEDEGHAVTIGVAAMPTSEEASAALDAQDLVGAQWFAGLPGEEGTPAERLGYSGGYGSSGQWGRYLLFSLSANSDGTEESGESESATELRAISEGFFDQTHTHLDENRG